MNLTVEAVLHCLSLCRRFMVRVRVRSEHRASIERTANGGAPWFVLHSAVPPLAAAHVKGQPMGGIMRTKSLLVLGTLLFAGAASIAQEHPASMSSAVPASARFEIVQSPLLAKLTLRLDRFTGDTSKQRLVALPGRS